MELNTKYSYRSWKRKQFLDVDPSEFDNTEIIGASFYQSEPYTDVFPRDVRGLVLTRCNLDNVNTHEGIVVNGGTNKHVAPQNDGEYWLVDREKKPVAPRDADVFDALGLSKDPKLIPQAPVEEPITLANDPMHIEQKKINQVLSDPVKLKQLLITAGELQK